MWSNPASTVAVMPSDDEQTEYRQHRFQLPPGATDLLLIRHGESAPARVGVPIVQVDGHADPDLDPRGTQEAELVAARLADEDVTAIYVTTLRRTVQTAAPLAARTGITPTVEADLREVYLGEWEGAAFRKHIRERHPIAVEMWEQQRWDPIPGSEPMDALRKRVSAAIGRIAAHHPDERVVAFTHGGIIGMIVHLATGSTPFAFVGADNGSLTHLVVLPDDRWIVRRFNDTGHLHTDLDRPPQPLT